MNFTIHVYRINIPSYVSKFQIVNVTQVDTEC